MQTGASGRPAKRARLEADKRSDALAKVEDKYADIDFTRFHRVEDESSGGATPPRFMLVRPAEAALVKDWRQPRRSCVDFAAQQAISSDSF